MASLLQLRLLLLTCLLVFTVTSPQVPAAQQQRNHHTIRVNSLLSSTFCSPPPAAQATPAFGPGGGNSLKIVHRECPPTADRKAMSDHYGTVLRQDEYRVQSIHRRLSEQPYTETTTIPARLGLPFNTHQYVTTIGIGTPPRNLTVLFDTSSDLTWVQCKGCSRFCYHQEEPMFDPSQSSSYANISCTDQECRTGGCGRQDLISCQWPLCKYDAEYNDKSSSGGTLARETVTLSPSVPPATGIIFGGGEVSTAFDGTATAGLLGLGQGELSILSQTRRIYNGSFSYCLPPHGSSTGHLIFGVAPLMDASLQFTPFYPNPQVQSICSVSLISISVNGAVLPVPAEKFSAGAIIDSGTVHSRITDKAYLPLSEEFRRQMSDRYTMVAPPYSTGGLVDTCYNVSGHDVVTVPRVALNFAGGASMDLDPSGILLFAGDSVACFPFVPMDSPNVSAIIGSMQQKAYNIVFDVPGGRIGFGANGCA